MWIASHTTHIRCGASLHATQQQHPQQPYPLAYHNVDEDEDGQRNHVAAVQRLSHADPHVVRTVGSQVL